MNGFIKRTLALACVGGLAAFVTGCCSDGNCGGGNCGSGGCGGGADGKNGIACRLYDNCWLERYSYQSGTAVVDTFATQVNNGHVLDQTLWTYHFEPGSAVLTKGGLDHLSYLARRRPQPDAHIYLQTAQDLAFDPAAPEKYAVERTKLDEERRQAILRYLNAETAGRPMPFEVTIHDPGAVGLAAPAAAVTITQHYASFKGTSGGAAGGGGGIVPPR